MKKQTFLAVFMLLFASPIYERSATGHIWWSGENQAGSCEVEIVVDGAPRPVQHAGGHSYSEGRMGERYVVRVHNRSWRRMEVVIAVDGRDAIDGRPANLGNRGYIIPAYSHIDVDGFRLSMDEVAAFRFTSVPDSYASRMGTPWEVGIIGVAVFPERVVRPHPRPYPPYVMEKHRGSLGDLGTAGASEAQAPRSESRELGTQFGERRVSPVTETTFARENWSQPAVRLSLRYNSREGLCAMGLGGFCYPPYPTPPWPPPPRDDPYWHDPSQFSNPPPGWEHFSPWY